MTLVHLCADNEDDFRVQFWLRQKVKLVELNSPVAYLAYGLEWMLLCDIVTFVLQIKLYFVFV